MASKKKTFTYQCDTVIMVPPLTIDPTAKTIDKEAMWKAAEAPVVARVNEIMNGLKTSEGAKKWHDPHFGPTEKDSEGAFSFYQAGKPPKGYADPSKCRWARPNYASEKGPEGGDDEDGGEFSNSGPKPLSDDACLFKSTDGDGADANDVKQGKLGDCWFLGALAVMAGRDDLLKKCFWKCEDETWRKKFEQCGICVCRFQKDCKWYYVVIDDSIPVFDSSNKPVFASSPDKSEMWVPLIEKAYAKLHGSYESLIGGYIDGGLQDMTGLISEQLVLREGHIGFHKSNLDDLEDGSGKDGNPRLLDKIDLYLNEWGSMMGCSIQPDPGSKGGGVEHKVLDDDGKETGLLMKHAFSLIDIGKVWDGKKAGKKCPKGKGVWLLKLRNPWGFGEWLGPWSDEWLKKKETEGRWEALEVKAEFTGPIRRTGKGKRDTGAMTGDIETVEFRDNDGAFFIEWSAWKKHFTVIFAGVDFPTEWSGLRICGKWDNKTAGGSILHSTWRMNPTYRFEIDKEDTHVFLAMSQDDPRLEHGRNYNKFQDPIAFHILKIDGKDGQPLVPPDGDDMVEGSKPEERQPVYKFHHANSLDVMLQPGEYVLVPSTFTPFKMGEFFISIYSDKPFQMEGASVIAEEVDPSDDISALICGKDEFQNTPVPLTRAERTTAVKFESSALKLLKARQKHRIKMSSCMNVFKGDSDGKLDEGEFKEKMKAIGFEESELGDFEVFAGGDEYMTQSELTNIFDTEMEKRVMFGMAQPKGGSASGEVSRGGGDESCPGGGGGDESTPGTAALSKVIQAKYGGGMETVGGAVQRLTKENMLLKVELAQIKVEMQNMMHIILLYGRMLGCYEGPVPSAEALPKLVPDTLPGMPKGTFGAGSGGGGDDEFALAAAAAGDESMAVKPWLGAIKATTPVDKTNDPGAPPKKLALEWVYGYQAQQSRGSLRYNAQGDSVYPAAGLGVIYNTKERKQTFFTGHDDDVICLAISPDRSFAVSGQMGKKPKAIVWDTTTGKDLGILLKNKAGAVIHQRAVSAVAISKTGDQIAMVGEDDSHSVSLWTKGKDASSPWSVKKGCKVEECKGNNAKTLWIVFTGSEKYPLATGGVKFVCFWDTSKPKIGGKGNAASVGKLKGANKNQPFISAVGVNGDVFTGAGDGDIYTWGAQSKKATKVTKAHAKSCDAISFNGEDGLVSGGKDGKVMLWTLEMDKIGEFDLANTGPAATSLCPRVRSVDWNKGLGSILVGTMGSEIYELAGVGADGKGIAGATAACHLQAHYRDELWAVAAHPTDNDVAASAGDDGTCRMWNLATHTMTSSYAGGKDNMARAVDFNHDGSKIAVGQGGRLGGTRGKKSKKGAVVLDAATMKEEKRLEHSKKWVQVVRFSPDGTKLAVGSHDNKTYLYKTADWKKKPRVCKKNSSFLCNIDWTAKSDGIQVTDGAHELLFYDDKGKQNLGGVVHDKLATFTCELGWPVQGIWPPEADGTDVNRCARSPDSTLLATGDDFGQLKIFNYPCVEKGAEFCAGRGHCSHVSCVVFSKDGDRVLSAGGNDRCVMQWKLS